MPTIPRANRRMNDMMRKERTGLEDYMYKGGGDTPPAPDAAIIAIKPDNEAAEPVPDSEMAEGEATATGLTVLDPGQPAPEGQYIYEQGDAPGSWMVYPPGVPCDEGTTRVALDHPATAEDFAQMDEALGTEEPTEPAYETAIEGGGAS